MRKEIPLAVVFSLGRLIGEQGDKTRQAPAYTTTSIVNAATGANGELGPNTLITIHGAGLAYTTRALRTDDIRDGVLPTQLSGTGVRVLLSGIPIHILYVSPTQINCLVPSNLRPVDVNLTATLDGLSGPAVRLRLNRVAPGLFTMPDRSAIALRPGGQLASLEARAQGGEMVVLFATGLGDTLPPSRPGAIANQRATLAAMADFRVLLNGQAVPPGNIQYAGATPGFAGVFQINVALPDWIGTDPEIRIEMGENASPPGILLHASPVTSSR